MSFEFVKYGLQTYPWRTWLLYGGLITGVALHACEGFGVLYARFTGKYRKRETRVLLREMVVGFMVLPVLGGLFSLSREPFMAFGSMAESIKAVYQSIPLFKL